GDKASGFDHDLAELFAQELGLKPRFVVARDPAELQALVLAGKAHLATSIAIRDNAPGLRFTSALRHSRQLLVEHTDDPPIEDNEGLSGLNIDALAGSPQAELLRKMNGTAPTFTVNIRNNSNEFDLFEQVNSRRNEMAASDEDHFRVAQNFFPDIKVAYYLHDSVHSAWAFPDGSAQFDRAKAFIERIRQDGTLARIIDRYFGHLDRVSDDDIADFLYRMQTVLPHYRADFIAAQKETGIDWRLLAALAYQESHWDSRATSPTGVRGMMMLTGETADRLRVTNRLDARQSIRAGGKYVADLINQLPPEIVQPDRTWLALAAYNLGMGHMNGARAIAMGLKRDPGSWYEMKRVLPLLAREKYYRRLKSGRGRGGEAVIMVENIRTYFDILTRLQPAHKDTGLDFRELSPAELPPALP
ncbi:MAG: membrane-bound lytic murein transglycosylase MltF, partial [Proteobacteria bacterium]|nr:membrane-bound lytic murein transglycosylase MltF [Pseudomonadota bacterium]